MKNRSKAHSARRGEANAKSAKRSKAKIAGELRVSVQSAAVMDRATEKYRDALRSLAKK